jgi:hypothetical protein
MMYHEVFRSGIAAGECDDHNPDQCIKRDLNTIQIHTELIVVEEIADYAIWK